MTDLSTFRVTDNVTDMLAAQYNRVLDATLRGELSNVETLAANRTLTDVDYPLQILTPTAARDVTLPAIAAANHPFYIHNDDVTYELTVKNAGGSMIVIIAPDRSSLIVADGTSWHALKLSEMEGDWLAYAATWTWFTRTQAYTNDPAAGNNITLNMADTTNFFAGDAVTVSSSAGSENTFVTTVVANTSITVATLALNHTTTTPVVTLLGKFTVVGDKTALFAKSTRVRYKQGGGYKYGIVNNSAYTAPNTIVTLVNNSDYQVTNAAITDTAYSYLDSPIGWPGWFSYVAAYTGFSADPGTPASRFRIVDKQCIVTHTAGSNGTSNTTAFTLSLPLSASASAIATVGLLGYTVDNGLVKTTPGGWRINASSVAITLYSDAGLAAWSGSNGKRAWFTCMYEI